MADMFPYESDESGRGFHTLLLGADVGATNSRVAVRAGTQGGCLGRLLGSARGPGYNRNSSGADALTGLADTVAQATGQAITALGPGDPGQPQARLLAVLGIAGAGPAHHHEVQEAVRDALEDQLRHTAVHVGREDLIVLDDQVTAFAAGNANGTGLLLLAGTGSAAVRYRDFTTVARCDGMGWLLGDTGSAVWIGRQVLQAVAAHLDARGRATALTAAVLEHLGLQSSSADPSDGSARSRAADHRQPLIAAVHRLSPAQWGTFARLPQMFPADPVSRQILERAAAELIAKVDALGPVNPGERIVLTGSVLDHNATVRAAVRAGLEERGLEIRTDAAPLDGALELAVRELRERDLRRRSRSRR